MSAESERVSGDERNAVFPALLDRLAEPGDATGRHAVRRSLALTRDENLRAALAELTENFPVTIVGSVEEFSDELMRARTPVALIDSAALPVAPDEFLGRLHRQFPDLVLIAAGNGADQSALARQVASAEVFRFLHKPASAQRLQIFLDSALRHHQVAVTAPRSGATSTVPVLPASAAATTPAGMEPGRRNNLILAAVAVAIMAAVGTWIALRPAGRETAPVATPNPAPAATQDGAPGAAASADAGTGTIPAAPAEDPQRTLDTLLGRAETALTEQRYDEAAELIESARPLAADSTRFRFLGAQLARERERAAADESRRAASLTREQRLSELLEGARRRIGEGALLDPARDSARAQVEAALALAPGDSDARALRGELTTAMLTAAEKQIEVAQVDGARRLLDAAAALGAASGNDSTLTRLRRRADELQAREAAQRTAAPAALQAPAVAAVTPPPAAPGAVSLGDASPPAAAPASNTASPTTLPATALRRVRGSDIDYPVAAERLGISGFVDVEFTVAADGAVKDVAIINAEPRGYFEANVQSGLRRWRYTPVVRNGAAVEQRVRLRLRFGFDAR